MRQHPIFDIWRVLNRPVHEAEAEIRALCQTAYLGDHEALCRVLGRYKMYVDTRDVGIASHLMLEGYWEMWVTQAMMRMVRRGSVVADLGANLGYFTLLLADLTGAEGRVLSLEPQPHLARLLRKSIDVNGYSGFTDFYSIALGSKAGNARIESSIEHPGGGRVVSAGMFKSGNVVPLRRFDELPHALDVEFIKMDVEGYEPEIWKGMSARLARRDLPLTLFMEFTVGRLPDPAGFLDDILGQGFALAIVSHDQGVIPIGREELLDGPPHVDHMLVFTRDASI